jgi:phosphomannomutase
VKFTAAYSEVLRGKNNKERMGVVVGRDARVSGEMVSDLVCGTLLSMGIDVLYIGLSTTPTVEMEVIAQKAQGGIIITASHNPFNWNALKLLDQNGEFFSTQDGELVLQYAENEAFSFVETDKLGNYIFNENSLDRHIEAITKLNLVDVEAITKANFKIGIDCVNSTGGIAIPRLLKSLGVSEIHRLHCEPNGIFPHNPEPLPEHLTELSSFVKDNNLDIGFALDPDVDRLAIVKENGDMFGEEYTLVAVADYVLQHVKGNTVSNLSSTQALKIVSEQHGVNYCASAVGEVNVVKKMKEINAVIGGEGNGGIIYPELHYGRDALVGIALFLTYLAKSGQTVSQLRNKYPNFHISKNKIELNNINTDELFSFIKKKYSQYPISEIDGIRIDLNNQWIHLRMSNTEPIIRIYAESNTEIAANDLAQRIITEIREFTRERI